MGTEHHRGPRSRGRAARGVPPAERGATQSWRPRPHGLALVALLFGACAYLPVPHERAPGHVESESAGDWRVRCEKIPNTKKGDPRRSAPKVSTWFWAEDASGAPVTLEGSLEDGFLIPTRASAPNFAYLRQACLETLRRRGEVRSHSLVRVRAARKSEGIVVSVLVPSDHVDSAAVSRVVVFGDSLSDAGLLRARMKVLPGTAYWGGRFSNGPVWPDYLEALLDVPVQNHALGGATVSPRLLGKSEHILEQIEQRGQSFVSGSTDRQIEDYTQGFLADQSMQSTGETLFILWAGANDYISKAPFSGSIETLLDSPKAEGGYENVVSEVMRALDVQVHKLYSAGGRRFLLINLPPLGRTPIVLQNTSYLARRRGITEDERRIALSDRLAELVEYHNDRLDHLVEQLREELPDARIAVGDVAESFTQLLDGDREDGGTTVLEAGFDLESGQHELRHGERVLTIQGRCYRGGYLTAEGRAPVCDHEDRAVFWDVVHPTTYAHCWQAYLVAAQMKEEGWIDELVPPDRHRVRCEARNDLSSAAFRVEAE